MKKALFLDRDGVINEDIGYLYRPEEFRFKEGIFELCKAAKKQGYLLIIATNQSGIARGLYSEEDYQKLTDWTLERFSENGICIDETYYCPFHPEEGLGVYVIDSPDRKPNPGMFLKAQRKHDLDMSRSIAIGDRETDAEAARRAGIGHLILLAENLKEPIPSDLTIIRNLREAIDLL